MTKSEIDHEYRKIFKEIIFRICKAFLVQVTLLEHTELPTMDRFCQDLVEIMTVFCSKIYGQRGHKNRKSPPKTENTQVCAT